MIETLKLDQIRMDGDTQSRVSIHEATVAEYAECLTEGVELPPVVVFFDGVSHWVGDGFHRLLANRRIGAVTLNADVRPGTVREAKMYAFGANQAHGLRRTNADKHKAVAGMLELVGEWSDRAIARHVGVSDKTVASLRKSAVTPDDQDSSLRKSAVTTDRTYTTKHGTQATMDTSGQKKAGAAKKTGKGSTATEPASTVTAADRAPGPVAVHSSTEAPAPDKTEAEQAQDDAYGDTNLVDELERANAEIQSLHEQVKAMSADDQKAETLKWRRAYDNAVRQQSEAMDRAKLATDREAFTMRQLRRVGKAIGVDDPSKIAPAVEAFMREHKKVAA